MYLGGFYPLPFLPCLPSLSVTLIETQKWGHRVAQSGPFGALVRAGLVFPQGSVWHGKKEEEEAGLPVSASKNSRRRFPEAQHPVVSWHSGLKRWPRQSLTSCFFFNTHPFPVRTFSFISMTFSNKPWKDFRPGWYVST